MINENEDRTTKVNAANTRCSIIVLPKYVDILISQSHIEYRKSWTNHVDQQDPHSLAKYLETHNAYVYTAPTPLTLLSRQEWSALLCFVLCWKC